MEFHISTNLVKVTHTFLHTCSPKYFFNRHSFRRIKFRRRLNSKPLQVALCSEKVSLLHGNPIPGNQETGTLGEDSEFVEVFGIGSRKEAILDFCLDSHFLSSSLRFWNILIEDSVNVQLQQRFTGKDVTPRVVEASSALQSCSKAVILVATAAYGSDHTRVVDILKGIKSAHGLVVGIILKPFSFEGRRRQDEIKDLEDKLKEGTNFCIVVDTDLLLEKDLVTLDEALKTANTAVLMAVNAISILIAKNHKKLLDAPQNNMKELKVLEVMKILESYKEAKIGFGAGFNTQTSFMRAIYDCPFLSVGLKDLDGIVFCILASSAVINSCNVNAVLHSFRQTTEYKGEIIISIVLESNLEPNLIMATVIAVRRNHPQSQDRHESSLPESPYLSEVMNSPESVQMPDIIPADETTEGFGIYSAELQTLLGNNDDKIYYLRGYDSSSEKKEVEFSEATGDSSNFYDANTKGIPSFQREPLIRRNLGPGYQSSEEWASQEVNSCGGAAANPMLDNLSIYKLPIGVKPSEELKNSLNISNTIHDQEKVAEDGVKQGVLSVRAASMLEAERDSQKKWNPIVEMKYRGGIYKGRCQGGLPEGKGRLSLTDGSSYDGMWRYGKRSGLGTFYFSNGDVFQGSWRDDVMHGKGWFYFHTGDRWFANFWKGKANGEGRFYSKLGEIFFGHFKDGWRHGHFLCINVDGARCLEIWDEGVLVSQKQLDAYAGASAG